MDICKRTHIECCECSQCCDSKINENKVAIDILNYATDLVRAIEYNDKNYIELNIDRIISAGKYFKDVFKY